MKACILDWTFCVIHTFCAIQSWWHFRSPDEEFPVEWWEHVDVTKTLKKRFGDMIKEFVKRYKSDMFIVACDCPRSDIWRMKLDCNYKSNRSGTKISKMGNWGLVFEMAAAALVESGISYHMIRTASAEADDVIAISCDYLLGKCETIDVVTGDSDIYQLEKNERVKVWDRKGKSWRSRLKDIDPEAYIQAKCYAGDSSDCIPSVGTRIGIKTALGWVLGTRAFPKDKSRINRERLELNRNLILFDRIPGEIREEIVVEIKKCV